MSGNKTILIVEDEPLIAMMLEDFLDELGHQVAGSCDNVADALDHVASGGSTWPPDRHAAAPVLAKPYTLDSIEPVLAKALGR